MADKNPGLNPNVPQFSLGAASPIPGTDTPAAVPGAEGAGTQPGGAQPPAGASAPTAPTFTMLDGGKFSFGGKEYTAEDLTPIIQAGIDPAEKERAATQKFQEAADLRKQVDTQTQELGHLRAIAQGLAELPNEAAEAVFAFARQIDQAHRAGMPLPSFPTVPGTNAAPAQAAQIPFSVPSDFKPDVTVTDFNNLSDEGKAIIAAFAPSMSRLATLEAQVGAMGKALPEVTAFVRGSQAESQANAAIGTIKTEHGIDVSPQDIKTAMQQTGIQNPHAAWVYANRASLQAAAANKAAEVQGTTPPAPPAGNVNEFNPVGMSADDIAKNLAAGRTMKQ